MRGGVLIPALALAAAACASDDRGSPILSRTPTEGVRTSGGPSRDGSGRDGPGPAGDDAPRAPAPVAFTIPADTTAQLDGWLERERTLLGDVVEVDLSEKFFLRAMSISLPRERDADGRPAVERIDATDPATGVLSIVLVNRSGYRTLDMLPTVRIGAGLTVIGTERVVLRFSGVQPESRPVWFAAVARGRARLLQVAPEKRLAGDVVRFGLDVVGGGGRYELRETEEAR